VLEGKEETVIDRREYRKDPYRHHTESKLFATRKVILDQGTGDNYPYRVDLPEDWPSTMACDRFTAQCEIQYTLTASLDTLRTSVTPRTLVSTKIAVLQKPSEFDSSLTINVGSMIPLTRSYFCGLWETPIDTYTLLPSLESVRLHPGQAFFVQVEDFKNLLKRQGSRMAVKLSERIDWTAKRCEPNNPTTYNESFRYSWELPLSQNSEARIPTNLHMTYEKGHLIKVQHELIVFVHDSTGQVLATTNRLSVRVVTAETFPTSAFAAPILPQGRMR
jgi:hypothetical protein